MERSSRLGIALTVALFAIFYLVVLYPSVDDFTFLQAAQELRAQQAGSIDLSSGTPGFDSAVVVLSAVTGISTAGVFFLPIQAIPLIALLAAFLRKASKGSQIYLPLGLAYITGTTNAAQFNFGVHWLGFLLALLIAVVVLNRTGAEAGQSSRANSGMLITALISLDLISYKLAFFTIIFLIVYVALAPLSESVTKTASRTTRSSLASTLLIGLIFLLSYNEFVYRNVIPSVGYALQSPASGLEAFLGVIIRGPEDPLSPYRSFSPPGLLLATIAWLLPLLLCLAVVMVTITLRLLRRERLPSGEQLTLATGVAAAANFGVYTILGYADISLGVVTGFAAAGTLSRSGSRRKRLLVVATVVMLLALNVAIDAQAVSYGFYNGQKDPEEFGYLSSVADWYARYVANVPAGTGSRVAVSDILTCGYLTYALAEKRKAMEPPCEFYSKSDLSFFLQIPEASEMRTPAIGTLFIINQRLSRFAIQGWELFNTSRIFTSRITTLPGISVIYSSGGVEILLFGPSA